MNKVLYTTSSRLSSTAHEYGQGRNAMTVRGRKCSLFYNITWLILCAYVFILSVL